MSEDMDFDGLLKFCVELSGKLDLGALLRDAELLCNYAGQAGLECVAGLPVLPHMRGAVALAPAALAAQPPAAGEEEEASASEGVAEQLGAAGPGAEDEVGAAIGSS